uniref:Plexin domain-containing protein 1 n=1 Tax=Cacopsylla melanoneura TaxID=428564 RepID=A0A8D8ZG86_9HEMI
MMVRTNLCLLCACFVISRAVSSDINNEHNNTRDNQQYYEISFNRDEKTVRELWLEMNDENCMKYSFMEAALWKEKYQTQNLLFNFSLYGENVHSVNIVEQRIFIKKEFSCDPMVEAMTEPSMVSPYWSIIAPFHDSSFRPIGFFSYIRVVSNDSQFTVSWENMEFVYDDIVSKFTFQATLHKTGDIVFVYKSIPYYNETGVGLFSGYQNQICEHQTIDLSKTNISTWTSIHLKHKPTCWNHKNCTECLSDPTMSHLNCSWGPSANFCASDEDRNLSRWSVKRCGKGDQSCPTPTTPPTAPATTPAPEDRRQQQQFKIQP